MLLSVLPNRLFGLELKASRGVVAAKVPRVYSTLFDIKAACLGQFDQACFIAAIAKEPPTVATSKGLSNALARMDSRPVVICWDAMSAGMMNTLAAAGISYIRDEQNAFLPFLGAVISAQGLLPAPRPLSAQAQRIVLNLIAGRWDGCSAGDLTRLTGKSGASVTKYLAEIQAIAPSLIESKGTRRILRNPGFEKAKMLDAFAAYFSRPAETTIRLREAPPADVLREAGALLAGESALAHFTDLAPTSTPAVALCRESAEKLRVYLADSWQEVEWYETCAMTVEIWPYPVDAPCDVSVASTGLSCVDALNLYIGFQNSDTEDVRLLDAIDQLKEVVCRAS